MNFRTVGAVAALLFAGAGDRAAAQYYPPREVYPPQTYRPAQAYPPQRPAPALEDWDNDGPFYDPPMVRQRPLPPLDESQEFRPQANVRAGRAPLAYPDDDFEPLAPPPGTVYVERPRVYDGEPGTRLARPNYAPSPPMPPGVAPQPSAPPGLAPMPAPSGPDAVRPPLEIGPAQSAAPVQTDQGATAAPRGDTRFAALPPDVRPETGPAKELPPQFRRTTVDYKTKEPAGTIVVDTQNTHLYLVLGNGKAMRYGIGVGREGFTWTGTEKVSRMAEWPDWHPPEEMIDRQPYLPRFMAGGPGNPLGARALYLGKTIYRIHGTNQPSTIGTFVSSGCIRLTNEDVMDLYTRAKVGTRVVVLPGKPPATPPAMPLNAPTAAVPAGAVAPPAAAIPPVPVNPVGPPVAAAPLPPPSAIAR
jgi:lipoprotein-anchoring transpeptidase ErfK/SrfK